MSRRRPLRTVLAGLLVLAVSACGERPTETGEAAPAGETRTVTHAMGTTEVTGTPGRVVVLDTGELDSA
jgi:iron complex transport system substrate-binding protein